MPGPSAVSSSVRACPPTCDFQDVVVPEVSVVATPMSAEQRMRDDAVILRDHASTIELGDQSVRSSANRLLGEMNTTLAQMGDITRADRALVVSALDALETRASDEETLKFETWQWVLSVVTGFVFALFWLIGFGLWDLFTRSDAEQTLALTAQVRRTLSTLSERPGADSVEAAARARAPRDAANVSTLAALPTPALRVG